MEEQREEEGQVAKPITLMELPTEIMLHIHSYLVAQDYLRFCVAAKRLKDVHLEFIMHLRRVKRQNGSGGDIREEEICASFNILEWATENYVLAGYDYRYGDILKFFYDFLLNYDSVPAINNVCSFLKPFYTIIETNHFTYQVNLAILNMLSLFNLLNKFKTLKVLKFEKQIPEWQVSVQINGYHVERLKIHSKPNDVDIRYAVLQIASLLLFSEVLGVPIGKDWHHLQMGIYKYESMRKSTVIFNITIETMDAVVLNLLKPALCSNHQPITNPLDKLECDVHTFNVSISVESRAGFSWAYTKNVLTYTYSNEQ